MLQGPRYDMCQGPNFSGNLNNVSKYIVSMIKKSVDVHSQLTLFLKCVDLGRNLTHFDYIFFNYYNNKATQDWCMYTRYILFKRQFENNDHVTV